MTDLNFSIENQSSTSIANYFGVPVEWVELAILEGARTYEEVYTYIKKERAKSEN